MSDSINETTKPNIRLDWTVDNSSFETYVSGVQFNSGPAKNIICKELGQEALGSVLDIAGGTNGQAIHDLINEGLILNGAYTNLVDERETDKVSSNVFLIEGDLTEQETWSRLRAYQKRNVPDGFRAVLHRPFGALQDLSATDYVRYVRQILDMIAPSGLFYTQIPTTYAYGREDRKLIDAVCSEIRAMNSVARVDVSLPGRTLADHKFAIIRKVA